MSSKMELSKVNMNEVIICDRLVFVKSRKKKNENTHKGGRLNVKKNCS